MQKNNGFDNGYKKLSIEYKTYQYIKNNQMIRYFFDKYMWNFGFDKTNLLFIIFYIIIFFTVINNFFYKHIIRDFALLSFLSIRSNNSLIENHFILRYLFYLPSTFIFTTLLILGGFLGMGTMSINAIKKENMMVAIYIVTMIICGYISTFLLLQYILK